MTRSPQPRSGNALFTTMLILTLVVTGTLAVTQQLMGRKRLEDLSRANGQAEAAATVMATFIANRIEANASRLMSDFTSGSDTVNPLAKYLNRGYVSDLATTANPSGMWLNGCLVYWRLEPVSAFDRTASAAGADALTDAELQAAGATKYLVNRSPDVAATATGSSRATPFNTPSENPGLLLFELTVDAYAMDRSARIGATTGDAEPTVSANPLAVQAGLTGANAGLRATLHHQLKRRVLVKSASLFRYVIFYNASGKSGDLELYQAPDVSVIGAVHTNGAAYLGHNGGTAAFGSAPAVADPDPLDDRPALRPILFTAVNGLFCMRKLEMYNKGVLDPMSVSRTDTAINDTNATRGGNPVYLNTVVQSFNPLTVGGSVVQIASVSGSVSSPFTVARDSRPTDDYGKPLDGYDQRLVRDGPNRQMRTINIAQRLNLTGYRPLEPFQLVQPGVLLRKDSGGRYSITNATFAATATSATDMLVFRSGSAADVLPVQNGYSGDTPSQTVTSLLLTQPTPSLVAAFTTDASVPAPVAATGFTTATLPGAALSPPVVCRTTACTPDVNDIFTNLHNCMVKDAPTTSYTPVLSSYIRNPLGMNQGKAPGVGIVILERAKQAIITKWPSGRLGQVTWDPPSIYSRNHDTNPESPVARYYDADNNGAIDAGMMTSYLMDYCQWLRSNYAVYFGLSADGSGKLVEITDQFFALPAGAAQLSDLLVREDIFKDRRESRWWQSSAHQYTPTASSDALAYEQIRVNALTLNLGAVCTFIRATQRNRLDPTSTSTAMASTWFNGTVYIARTPRYSAPGNPATTSPTTTGTYGARGCRATDLANLFSYRQFGEFHPLAPLGFHTLQTDLNSKEQRTTIPAVMRDTISAPAGGTALYPAVGDANAASMNGSAGTAVDFGSTSSTWSMYPLLKRVRVTNAATIGWGGVRPSGRSIGVTIYTPNVCYLQGNFNANVDATGRYPACAVYCDALTMLSNAWSDTSVNDLAGTGTKVYTNATSTVFRIAAVIHNNPTDLGNITSPDVAQPGGSGGMHNVIKFLENWSGIDWAFVGSLVILDRARYTRGYLGNQDVYEPPKRRYSFNDDLLRELPPFSDVISDVFIW